MRYRQVWWVSVDTGCVWCGVVDVDRNTDMTGVVGMKLDRDSVVGVTRDTDRCGECGMGYRHVWWVWNWIQTDVVCVSRDTDMCGGCEMGYRQVWWVSVDTGCAGCGRCGTGYRQVLWVWD